MGQIKIYGTKPIKESLGCQKQSCGKRRADRQEGAGSRAGLDRTCSISDVIRLSGFTTHRPVAVGSGSAPLVSPVPLAGQDFTPEALLVCSDVVRNGGCSCSGIIPGTSYTEQGANPQCPGSAPSGVLFSASCLARNSISNQHPYRASLPVEHPLET